MICVVFCVQTVFALARGLPQQFVMCGVLQTSLDFVVLYQMLFAYPSGQHTHTRAGGSSGKGDSPSMAGAAENAAHTG
jgi:hypothetical protein